ncbi:MAG: PilT/PilU family type 4a pilus ATPase [bacterium]|nr:PilT/PilU family type 4a pilus ATPase [bacterium]
MHIDDLLKHMEARDASDLYLKVGVPPMLRVAGELKAIDGAPLSGEEIRRLADQIMTDRHRLEFEDRYRADIAYSSPALGRFRVNVYVQRGSPAAVIRRVKSLVPSFDDLRLPPVVGPLALGSRGLVLVVGQTGSGKSTTLAAMISHRSRERDGHIVTIEDPIEFVHPDDRSIVSQREIGTDCESYSLALRDVLRQAPDVVLIGEIRDDESATAAVHFAETGHLVLSTLHANNASQTLERLLHFFPAAAHESVAMQLSMNLNAIIAQRLLARKDGAGRIVAVEVMLSTPRVRELLRKADLAGIRSVMQSAAGIQEGMRTFDYSLFLLIKEGLVDEEVAMAAADSPNDLRMRLKGLL